MSVLLTGRCPTFRTGFWLVEPSLSGLSLRQNLSTISSHRSLSFLLFPFIIFGPFCFISPLNYSSARSWPMHLRSRFVLY